MSVDRRTRIAISAHFFFSQAALGLITPFSPVYFKELGFSYVAWGAIAFAAAVCGAVVQLGIGYISDRLKTRKSLIIGGSFMMVVLFQLFQHLRSYEALLIAFAIYGILSWSLLTLVNALIGDISGPGGQSFIYASIRVFGSLGWIVSLICTVIWPGMVQRPSLFFAMICIYYLISGIALIPVKEPPVHHIRRPSLGEAGRALVCNRNMLLFIFAYLIFMLALSSVNNFLGLMIRDELGLTPDRAKVYVSWAFMVSAICEMPFLLGLSKLSDRIGRRPMLIVAFIWLPIRIFLLSRVSSPEMAVGVQMLHGLTWGIMMWISVAFVAESVPINLRASGQGLLTMITAASNGLWAIVAGKIGDLYSLGTMLMVVAIISAFALMIGIFIKEPSRVTELTEKAVVQP